MYFYVIINFLIISCFYHQIVAHEPLVNQPINVTSQAAPDTFVNGTISAIEGNFCYTFHHLAVPGHVPLDLVQYYNSKSNYSSWLGTGMSLNYSFWIAGRDEADKTKDKYHKYSQAIAEGPGGSIILCLGKFDKEGMVFFLDPDVIHDGLTNTGSGQISARTNLKNWKVSIKSKHARHGNWTAYLPDGTIKEYYKSYHFEHAMNALSENRPNRTRLDYSYYKYHEQEGQPREIRASGKNFLNQLNFEIDARHKVGRITSSNDKEAKFRYREHDGDEYIYAVTSSDNPTVKFEYTEIGGNFYINRISWPSGRFLEMNYDSKGRVKAQKAPVGKNGEKRTIYTLDYHDNYTKVLDAYDHKMIYRYANKRLTSLEEYGKNDKHYRTQRYFWGRKEGFSWGKHPDRDEGNLISEVVLDKNKKAHSIRHFVYDTWGNVKIETLYGNLSGNGEISALSAYGTPRSTKSEKYCKHYWYSNDRLRLPVAQWEENGLAYEYRYEHDSDLMWAKLTKEHDKIIVREFYSYDEEGILVEKILDNGTDPNKDMFTDVTQRFITTIVPVKKGYGVGQPESITENFLNLETKKRILLKRTEYSYNKAGLVIKARIFDADNNHRYTLETDYNAKGRVEWRTNELGHRFEYDYDSNCNTIYEKQVGAGFYSRYEYDKSNRMTAVIQHHDDGTVVRTSCEYDLMGNKTSTTDRYGIQPITNMTTSTDYKKRSFQPSIPSQKSMIFSTMSFLKQIKMAIRPVLNTQHASSPARLPMLTGMRSVLFTILTVRWLINGIEAA